MLMNGIMMDLHIKPMKKKEYITPSLLISDVDFEGFVCMSSLNHNMMVIDDVNEGTDYGYL